MKAMVFRGTGKPLQYEEVDQPTPQSDQILIKVHGCAICRTDLHIIDGELSKPKLPLILGHQVVGIVEAVGPHVIGVNVGEAVGLPWLGKSCQTCDYCLSSQENLCPQAQFTGYDIDGGYAEYCVAHANYVFPLPSTSPALAPLLCGGAIGYRALRLAGKAKKIGFYGFGSAAHQLIQLVSYQGGEVYAFTRPGDKEAQLFAKQLGAVWAGDSDKPPPRLLDAAILFAPVGSLFPQALKMVRPGGTVISAGIHMSPIPSFNYELLWEERIMRSVANLTRDDAASFLKLAYQIPIKPLITCYPLQRANEALADLKAGRLKGSAVLTLMEEL